MATVIDALLVTLGLDSTGFQKGQKDAADSQEEFRKRTEEDAKKVVETNKTTTKEYKKGQKESGESQEKFRKESESNSKKVNAQSKAMAEGFGAVKGQLLGLVAVGLGAVSVKSFFEDMVHGQATLGRSARSIGISARELDGWRAAAETVGGTGAGIEQTMKSIQAGFQAFRLGDSNNSVVAAFRAMQINITDANRQIRPMRDLMLDIAGAMKGRSAQDQLTLAGMLGADEGSLNLLREGRISVEQLLDRLTKASGVTDASAEASIKAQAKWAIFKRELAGVGQSIFVALIPAMEGANESMLKMSNWAQENKGAIAAVFDGIATAAGVAKRAITDQWDVLTKISKLSGESWLGKKYNEVIDGVLGDERKVRERAEAKAQIEDWIKKLGAYGRGESGKVAGVGSVAGSVAGAGRGLVNPGQPPSAASASSGDKPAVAVLDGLEKSFGLPAGMLDRIWNIESGRGKNMVSPAGATGHFQFMPATAKEMGMTREDTFDFEKSSKAAAEYLAKLMKLFDGDEMKAVAAYNWGMGNVQRKGLDGAPKETVDYLRKYTGGMPIGAGANSEVQAARGDTSIHNETHIGSLTVQVPQATDAQGIARGLPDALAQNSLIPTYQTGMN